ncbi:MAG: B12-binding domain-containing radical SAM protein [Clostridia bacterium]|nr:B12-binding domain-containing radical SAM protein [Clostridia bacterium]
MIDCANSMLEVKTNVDILLIIPPFHIRNGGGAFFPLGLGYIISELDLAGYSWEVINCTEFIETFFKSDLEKLSNELKKSLLKYNPSVIGIGPCITTQVRALKIISDVCNNLFPNVPIFAGGPLASIENQEWFFHEELGIKYIIKGDGEKAVVDAVQTIKEGKKISDSKFVSYEGYSYVNYIEDINNIAFPYRSFDRNNRFSIRRSKGKKLQAAMIASRGCPYSCNYCVSGNLKYNNISYRRRDIRNIIDEMQKLNEEFGVDDIVFYDDCFFYNPQTVNIDVLAFCKSLSKRNIHLTWQIEMRPDVFCKLTDDSIIALNRSGCRQISLGIEKISSKGLSFLGKKNCWPKLSNQIKRIKCFSNISISATFILGGENETVEDIFDLIEQTKDLQLDFAHYNPLFVYPGTPIYDMVFENEKDWVSYILEDDLPWGEIVYETAILNKTKLLELVDFAYQEFYKNTPYASQQMIVDRFNLKE